MSKLPQTGTYAIENAQLRRLQSRVYHLLDRGTIRPQDISNSLYVEPVDGVDELFFSGNQITDEQQITSYWELSGNEFVKPKLDRGIYVSDISAINIDTNRIDVVDLSSSNIDTTNLTSINIDVNDISSGNVISDTASFTDISASEILFNPAQSTTSGYVLYRNSADDRLYYGNNVVAHQAESLWEFDNQAQTRIRPKIAGNSDYPAVDLKGKLLDGTSAVAIKTHTGNQFVGSGISSDYWALNYSTENSANYSYPYLYSVSYNGVNKHPVSPFRFKVDGSTLNYQSQYLVNMNNFNLANVGDLNANIGYFNTIDKLSSQTGAIDVLREIDMSGNDLQNVGNMNTGVINMQGNDLQNVANINCGNINMQGNDITNGNDANFNGHVQITGGAFTGGSGIDGYTDGRVNGVLNSTTNIANFFNSNITTAPIGAFPSGAMFNVVEANVRSGYDPVVKSKHFWATGDITCNEIYASNFIKRPQSGNLFEFIGDAGGALIKAGAQVIGSATLASGLVLGGGLIAIGSLKFGGEETFYVINNGSQSQYPDKMKIAEFYGNPVGSHGDYWFGHYYATLNRPERSAQSGTEVVFGYGLDPLSNRLTITNLPLQTEDNINARTYSYDVYYGGDPMGLKPDVDTQCYNAALSMTHEYFNSIELKNYSTGTAFQNQAASFRAGTNYRRTQSLPETNRLYSMGGNLYYNNQQYRKWSDNQFYYGVQLIQYNTSSAANLIYQNQNGHFIWADSGGGIHRVIDDSIIGNYALPYSGGTLTGDLLMTDSTDTFTFNVGSNFLNIKGSTTIASFNDSNINLNKRVYFGNELVLSGDVNDCLIGKTGADNKSLLIQAGDNAGSGTDDYEILFKTRNNSNTLYTAMNVNGKDEEINFYKNTQHRTGVIKIYDKNNNPFNNKDLENIGGVLYWGGTSFSTPWTTDAINNRISTTFENLQLGGTNGAIQNSVGVTKFGFTTGNETYTSADAFYIYPNATTANPLLTANTSTSQVSINGALSATGNISNSVLSANTGTSQVDITGDLVVSGTITGAIVGLTINTSQITADSDLNLGNYDLYCNECFPNNQCKINFGSGATAGAARLIGNATYADVALTRDNGGTNTNLVNSTAEGGLIVDRVATAGNKRVSLLHDGTDSILKASDELKIQALSKVNIGRFGITHHALMEIEEVTGSQCDITCGSGIAWSSGSNIRVKGFDDAKRLQFDYNDGTYLTDNNKVTLKYNYLVAGVEVQYDTLEANANRTFRNNGQIGMYQNSNNFAMFQTNGQMTTERGGQATWYLGNGAFGGWTNGNADWSAGHGAMRFASNMSNGNFWIGGSLTQNSDRRIKKNIETINDGESLTMLEKIEAYTYNYIDENRGKEKVYGWIAQNVREHFPQATSIMKQQIPNIMQTITINKNKITLPSAFDIAPNTQILIQNLKDFDYSNKEIIVETKLSSKEYLINEELDDTTGFCYGVFIDDFVTIEKEKLVPILWSATQEINKRNSEVVEENIKLKSKISNMEILLAEKEVQYSQLQSKIERIEQLLLRNNIR